MRRNGDRVDIEIIDNGAGLPKHNRNRLLEPYVTTKGNKGTGLGLAIVQKSVEQHNGVLSLEDAPLGAGPHAWRAASHHAAGGRHAGDRAAAATLNPPPSAAALDANEPRSDRWRLTS